MFPTPWTVTVHPFVSDGGRNAHGNPTRTFGPDRLEKVYGWAPPSGPDEADDSNRSLEVILLDLLVPPTFTIDARDEVTVEGRRFKVSGGLQDFTKGPFGFVPGGRVRLERDKELG